MTDQSTRGTDLRRLGRNAIRAEAADRAIRLLDERGFDETTVEEISAAAGMSPRSFFRYFTSKEEVVIGDLLPMGHLIEDALRGQDESVGPMAALQAALEPLIRVAEGDPTGVLRSTRVALSTPGLRARTLERHAAWADLLTPIVAARIGGKHPQIAAEALSHSALSCLYVATKSWVEGGGNVAYRELIDLTFDAIAHA